LQVLENNILEKEQVKYKKLVPPKIHEKIDETNKKNKVSKPKWIRVKLPIGKKYTDLRNLVDKYKLNTICTSGSCPNMGECWAEGTATFMILGNVCTRSCGFCAVKTGRPSPVDWSEPEKVAQSIYKMGIKHAVITSVDRDDLKDMGSIIWAESVMAIRRLNPKTTLETLIPDFQGNKINIDRLIKVAPEVISHNLETVRRLTREVRIQAKYDRSLEVLSYLKEKGVNRTKSGIMLGLGETEEEVYETLNDLTQAKVDIVTMGQYLQPTKNHLPVSSFITPDDFKKYEKYALNLGFRHVESGPLVRSSYKAHKHIS
jgi:lipoic acid synthetase